VFCNVYGGIDMEASIKIPKNALLYRFVHNDGSITEEWLTEKEIAKLKAAWCAK
jgi:hypothetical protein